MRYDCTIRALFPQRSEPMALRITGKTHDDLRKGVEQIEAVDTFEKFLATDGSKPSHRCIVAHNRSFDQRFMHALWIQHKRDFPADLWVDTIPMFKSWAKKQGMVKPSAKLEAVAAAIGARKVPGLHNAVDDSKNLYFIFQKLEELGEDFLSFAKLIPCRSSISKGDEENDLMKEAAEDE
jgi:DNA polymerase III epsilon subunit-like protein